MHPSLKSTRCRLGLDRGLACLRNHRLLPPEQRTRCRMETLLAEAMSGPIVLVATLQLRTHNEGATRIATSLIRRVEAPPLRIVQSAIMKATADRAEQPRPHRAVGLRGTWGRATMARAVHATATGGRASMGGAAPPFLCLHAGEGGAVLRARRKEREKHLPNVVEKTIRVLMNTTTTCHSRR